jgi:hypothetical protein
MTTAGARPPGAGRKKEHTMEIRTQPWRRDAARYADARDAVMVAEHDLDQAGPGAVPGLLGRVETLAVLAGTALDLAAEAIDQIPADQRDWDAIAEAAGLDKPTVWRLWRAFRDDPAVYAT